MPIKKKIIIVVPSLSGGGAEKVASTLLDFMHVHEQNIEIVLVLFDRSPFNIVPERINIRYLDVKPAENILSLGIKTFKIIFGLRGIIKEAGPCSVLSFMEYPNLMCILGNILAGRNDRVVITVHILPSDVYKNSTQLLEKIMMKLVRRFYKRASAIVAVSKGIRNDLIANFRVAETKSIVIPNPIDPIRIEQFSCAVPDEDIFKDDIPVILAAGRLTKQKGFNHLLKAFAAVCKKKKAFLAILGEGEERENLNQLIRELGIGNNARLLGFKENPYAYMKRSTIFVLSSVFEGFGVVILEAMVCGLPVIATRSYDGIEDIIENEKNGLLIPVADVRALADAMLKLLDNENLRNSLAEDGKKKAEQFSVDKIAEIYKRVLCR